MLKEEVWESSDGGVVRYSLAYINPSICGLDNGRVLGYDNSHDHRRNESLAARFYAEVRELWRKEDEERHNNR